MNTFEDEVLELLVEEAEVEEPTKAMPCIPLRGLLIFPNTVLHFDVGREKSIKALENSMANDKLLFVSSQKDENILIPTEDDYYKIAYACASGMDRRFFHMHTPK